MTVGETAFTAPSSAQRARRWCTLAILLLAAAVRLPAVFAAYPYMGYVDEGNYLNPARVLYTAGGWDPHSYLYPSLPVYLAVASFHAAAGVAGLRGQRLASATPVSSYYDHFEPPEFLVATRFACWLGSLALVWLTMRLGARCGGELAGALAGLFAALLPALVMRGGIANVDVWATLFTVAALLAAECARDHAAQGAPVSVQLRWASAVGASAGLAVDSKYQTALVVLALVPVLLAARGSVGLRCARLGAAAVTAVLAVIVAMPAWIVKPRAVLAAVAEQRGYYRDLAATPTYWQQAVERAEWDQPVEAPELGVVFLLLAAVGFVVLLRHRERRSTALAWLAYAAATLGVLGSLRYQPFRSLLPLVPPACVLAGVGLARLASELRRLGRWAPVVLATTVVFVLTAPATSGYAVAQARRTDSRAAAIQWLRAHARPGDRTIAWEELAILPGELRTLPASRSVAATRAAQVAKETAARYLVAGQLAGAAPAESDPRLLLRARFGTTPTTSVPGWWHTNEQIVEIYEVRTPRPSGPRKRRRN
jgi:4-amino-4-deoxy-L-arabinose transferase-like glycosyltransferase